MKEIIQDKKNWVQIKGMPYYISKQGQVYSVTSKRVLKPILSKKGYYIVSFKIKGHRQRFFLHRIIAEAFIPNPENKPQVNHIDGIKSHNYRSNLEWVTGSENMQHAYAHNLVKDKSEAGKQNIINAAKKTLKRIWNNLTIFDILIPLVKEVGGCSVRMVLSV